jgi:hypothetical protein
MEAIRRFQYRSECCAFRGGSGRFRSTRVAGRAFQGHSLQENESPNYEGGMTLINKRVINYSDAGASSGERMPCAANRAVRRLAARRD